MEIAAVFAFAALAATLIAVPGPDWAFIITAGSRDRVVLPAVSGVVLGYMVLTSLVALGVGAMVVAAPSLLTTLTLAGSGYLIYLGVRSFVPARTGRRAARTVGVTPTAGHLARGVGVSSLNPKAILIFLAILPQFARTQYVWPVQLQLAVLGLIFTALCAMIYLPLGLTARKVSNAKPRLAALMPKIAGASMVVVGATLVTERVVELLH